MQVEEREAILTLPTRRGPRGPTFRMTPSGLRFDLGEKKEAKQTKPNRTGIDQHLFSDRSFLASLLPCSSVHRAYIHRQKRRQRLTSHM
jgi:hypothetical protein